jgi:hypothetical protein
VDIIEEQFQLGHDRAAWPFTDRAVNSGHGSVSALGSAGPSRPEDVDGGDGVGEGGMNAREALEHCAAPVAS